MPDPHFSGENVFFVLGKIRSQLINIACEGHSFLPNLQIFIVSRLAWLSMVVSRSASGRAEKDEGFSATRRVISIFISYRYSG